jgi:hypothetical protein
LLLEVLVAYSGPKTGGSWALSNVLTPVSRIEKMRFLNMQLFFLLFNDVRMVQLKGQGLI